MMMMSKIAAIRRPHHLALVVLFCLLPLAQALFLDEIVSTITGLMSSFVSSICSVPLLDSLLCGERIQERQLLLRGDMLE